ncbi:metal dependent phosphohydrolase [Desulfofundulus kuznetsovii DSM 6115]|uniref:Metal dependent phosphohydrolase n=1 Tax=Desulfofundulus kuznetsovii (strain DSM 6115 / VKM B-1805 / 17) TaxID=760568 RepID=A0AAU8PBI7_DESK7|nr:metal dependent phosphohydrolase [Desulfofundulus kuznetsovii DSM 6115]
MRVRVNLTERGVVLLKISTKFLLPGMKLARPVYGKNGELLLKKGVVLTAGYVMSLRRCGILAVDVDGLTDLSEEHRNLLEDEVRSDVMNVVRGWSQGEKRKGFERVVETVERIVDEILSGKEVIGNLTEICSADMYTYAHSVDVCVLSLTVGVKLGYSRKDLLLLGMGSLLHDLGKSRVPPEILNKPGKLTPGEFREIKKHPVYGYKIILESQDRIDSRSAAVILNHHERYDGTGYPRGLKGEEIDEMSAICAVADVYNAITTDRVYRKAYPPHEAYEMVMASGNLMFSARVVEAFLKCVLPYPPGSVVRLSNDLIGVVSRVKQGFPFRPVVRIVNSGEELDLLQESSVVITGLLRSEELRDLLTKGGMSGAAAASSSGRAAGNN